ncbi:type II toxin-antitoxin system VapC family toxin [Nostoc sp.]|uniref:type II toxin-antitoxin system VapC family toxin n=1 Tax=Nostoc sp. TaxID=1180 RepID=UPI002FFAEFBF
MKVLIDTNIVLDFLLQREPFFQDAELLFQEIDSSRVVGYVTATTLTDIFYISRRHTRSIDYTISIYRYFSVCSETFAIRWRY